MLNIESIYYFIFVFSILVLLKNIAKLCISALLTDEPKPFVLSDRELILLGISISYFLTYIRFI
jgi:hypothetical protein